MTPISDGPSVTTRAGVPLCARYEPGSALRYFYGEVDPQPIPDQVAGKGVDIASIGVGKDAATFVSIKEVLTRPEHGTCP